MRITLTLSILVAVACALALGTSAILRAGRDLVGEASPRVMMFGMALRDVALIAGFVAALLMAVLAVTWSTTRPVLDLTRAAQEIARGNFDVQVHFSRRATELLELETAFNAMARELKNNEYLRRDFIANASHEMKTPLAVIRGYAQLLEEEGLSPRERRDYAALIARETERLSRMTGNMMRLGRLENGALLPRQEEFSLSEQLRQAVLRLEPRWSEKDLAMEADLPEVLFTGDQELLGEVWLNLLDNAVKFTPAGGSVTVSLLPAPDRVAVTVRDTGPGMDEKTLAQSFEPFFQGDTSHREEGCGLGLALVRRITELHGGEIAVDSAPGQGTAVTVSLPQKTNKRKNAA